VLGKAKLHGFITDKKELAGKPGAPVTTGVVHTLDAASAQMIADLVK
jgi:hypothetical protein